VLVTVVPIDDRARDEPDRHDRHPHDYRDVQQQLKHPLVHRPLVRADEVNHDHKAHHGDQQRRPDDAQRHQRIDRRLSLRHARLTYHIMRTATIVLAILMIAAEKKTMQQLIPPDAKVEKLAGGMHFIEGPVWSNEDGGFLIFSDIPANELKRWNGKEVTTFRSDTHGTNGNTRDREGRLISCEHTSRRVTRTENDGSITVLADKFQGKRFNRPNDVVVKSDGSIWFTDPTYGLPNGEKKELDGRFVF